LARKITLIYKTNSEYSTAQLKNYKSSRTDYTMPMYEYQCTVCTHITEELNPTDKHIIQCPVCDSQAERIISLSSFTLKGSGWYKDGYTNKPIKKESDVA